MFQPHIYIYNLVIADYQIQLLWPTPPQEKKCKFFFHQPALTLKQYLNCAFKILKKMGHFQNVKKNPEKTP